MAYQASRYHPLFHGLLLLVALACCPLWAAESAPPPPARETQRTVIPLNTDWECSILPGVGGTKAAPSAQPVQLPLSWATTPLDEQGTVQYAREFTFPATMDASGALLVIENPVGLLDVLLDGQPIAHLLGNGLPRRIRLTGKPEGIHRLALRLTAEGLPEELRGVGCGLGPVALEVLPSLRVEALTVLPEAAAQRLTVRYRIFAEQPTPATLRLEVFAPDARRAAATAVLPIDLTPAGLEGERVLTIKAPRLWSPETPVRYRLRATLASGNRISDVREIACGFCTVKATATGLMVNGVPVILKGLRLAGGMPSLHAPTVWETLSAELTLAQRAGFTAIVAEKAALPEEALALADRLGLLVISTVPPDKEGGREAAAAVEEMGHHPSLIAWTWTEAGGTGRQVAALHALDPLRPLFVRDGASSQVFQQLASSGEPLTVCELDQRQGAWLATLDTAMSLRQPLWVTIAPDWEQSDLLSEAIERVRLAPALLGYFITPPPGKTLTGLATPEGLLTPTFTAACVYNHGFLLAVQSDATVPPGTPLARKAAIINQGKHTGPCTLYVVLVSPDGETSVTETTLDLTGVPVQDITAHLGLSTARPGTYRLQIVLTEGKTLLATRRVQVQAIDREP